MADLSSSVEIGLSFKNNSSILGSISASYSITSVFLNFNSCFKFSGTGTSFISIPYFPSNKYAFSKIISTNPLISLSSPIGI